MSYSGLISVLKAIGDGKNKPVKEEYDFEDKYPKLFSEDEHYRIFLAGSFCAFLAAVIVFYIR